MIHVSLVGGSLGAGKTTWVTAHLHARAADELIINDAASIPLDAQTIAAAAGAAVRIIEVTGGCVCCDKLPQLQEALLQALDRSRSDQRPHHLIVETSGLAKLDPILSLLMSDPRFRSQILLDQVVVVIDGVDGARAVRHRSAIRDQVRLADRIVISRADLLDEAHVRATARLIRAVTPTAVISSSRFGRESVIEDDALGGRDEPGEAGEQYLDDSADGESAPRAHVLHLGPRTSWAEYALWLELLVTAHPTRVVRSKGVVPSPNGVLVVQSVGSMVAWPSPAPVGNGPYAVVLFLDELEPARVEASFAHYVPSAVS